MDNRKEQKSVASFSPNFAQFDKIEWIHADEKKQIGIHWLDPNKKQIVRPPLQLIQRWVRTRAPDYSPIGIFGHIYPENTLLDVSRYNSVRLATILTASAKHPLCELSVIKSLSGENMPRFRMRLYSQNDMSVSSTYEWTWKTKNNFGEPHTLLDMVREYVGAFLGETLTIFVPQKATQQGTSF